MSTEDAGDRDVWLSRALSPYLSIALPASSDRASRSGVLLAVSGGPDSTALMHAAAEAGASVPVFVATIDHGLRPESAAEAASVGDRATRLGLPHRTLVWAAPRTRSRMQEAARAARYELLAAHAVAVGADTVLTGHTADDQAETVLMRLLAGSGPAGLAGMRPERRLTEGVRLARPFLDLSKAELVAYCETRRLPFFRDPSNGDERYARTRLRRLMPSLESEGLSAARLCRLAARLRRDEAALARAAQSTLAEASRPAEPGCVRLDGARLIAEPDVIVLRLIDVALASVRLPRETAPARRLERLERLVIGGLVPALGGGRRFGATLRGVLIEATPDGTVTLAPAPPRRIGQGRHSPPRGGLAAGAPDLLGKGEPAAYIGRERVE